MQSYHGLSCAALTQQQEFSKSPKPLLPQKPLSRVTNLIGNKQGHQCLLSAPVNVSLVRCIKIHVGTSQPIISFAT